MCFLYLFRFSYNIMMTTVSVKLNEDELEKIDYLVKLGRYENRSQAY